MPSKRTDKKSPLTRTQKKHLDEVMESLREEHPDVPDKDLVAKYIIPSLLGQGAKWNRNGHQIIEGAAYHAGAFCIFWGRDPDTGQVVTLLHVRKEKDGRKHLFGLPGGYVETKETTSGALKREIEQELCNASGVPVFPVDEDRFVVMHEAKSYRQGRAIQFTSLSYELNSEELQALKNYSKSFKDAALRKEVRRHTERETYGIKLLPLIDVAQMKELQFTYPAHYHCLLDMVRRHVWNKGEIEPASPFGHTRGEVLGKVTPRIEPKGGWKR